MCGILGIKNGAPLYDADEEYLIDANKKRGSASFINFTTPIGTFWHFRAPTSGCDLNNLSEAYPLTYNGMALIGNGVINETYFKSIKDEDNNNDLYYILKGIQQHGLEFLEGVDGCFALVIFDKSGDIFLVKNTFPLYYSAAIFSSVKFDGAKMLEDGVVLRWNDGKIFSKLHVKESPFLV